MGTSKLRKTYHIWYNVALSDCIIGDSCVDIHNGMCIGQDVLKTKAGSRVEIGANTCIDRGSCASVTFEYFPVA
ncbi:hypothetical protein LguiA_029252 [Lonicera macranthoides]